MSAEKITQLPVKNSEMPTVEQMVQKNGGWVERPTHEVFGFDEPFEGEALKTVKVPRSSKNLPFLIERNPKIVLEREDVRRLLTARYLKRPVMLNGPKGTGKTELFEQFYAAMGLPCIVVQCGPGVDSDYLFGRPDLDNGSIGWVDGFATLARRLGAGLLFDEMDGLRSNLGPELNGFVVMEKPFTLSGQGFKFGTKAKDLVVPANEHFFLCATTNTGGKVEGGMDYVGRNPIDQATLDRFLHFDKGYMPVEQERKVLKGHCPYLPAVMIEAMVDLATDIREAHGKEEVFEPVSLRSLVMWGQWVQCSDDPDEGFRVAVLGQMREHDAEFAKNAYEAQFKKLQD